MKMKDRENPARGRAAPDVGENVGFNMTPMIDIVFQLIIFFMLITDMSQVQIERLQAPVARRVAEERTPPKERMIVNVTESGEIRYYGQPMPDLQTLGAKLAERADRHRPPGSRRPSEVALMIRADARAPFEHVQKVLQVCGDERVRIYRLEFGAKQGLFSDGASER
jgi:biopolymer transport protein ExbD